MEGIHTQSVLHLSSVQTGEKLRAPCCFSDLALLLLFALSLPVASDLVVFRRQNSILLVLLRSLSQLWLPKRLQISICQSAVCRGAELESLSSLPIETVLLCAEYFEREILQPSGYSLHLWGEAGRSICGVKDCLLSGWRKQKNKEGNRR